MAFLLRQTCSQGLEAGGSSIEHTQLATSPQRAKRAESESILVCPRSSCDGAHRLARSLGLRPPRYSHRWFSSNKDGAVLYCSSTCSPHQARQESVLGLGRVACPVRASGVWWISTATRDRGEPTHRRSSTPDADGSNRARWATDHALSAPYTHGSRRCSVHALGPSADLPVSLCLSV